MILTGVCFEINNSDLNIIATDSYRLAKKHIVLDKEYNHTKINIPNKALEELEKILTDSEEPLEIYLISNKALVYYKGISFITRLIEGNFPDTSALFPKDELTKLSFKKSELLSTVDRVALFTNMDSSNIVKVMIKANKAVQFVKDNAKVTDEKATKKAAEKKDGEEKAPAKKTAAKKTKKAEDAE